MKTRTNLFKRITLAVAVITTIAFTTGCDKDDDDTTPPQNYAITGNANSSQVVPAVTATGSGTINGSFNPNNNQFIYTSTWTGLTAAPIAGGFFIGATGIAGTLTGDPWTFAVGTGASGSVTDTLTLTADQATQLTNGNLYYTYGTTLNPLGEIRGQITATR